MAKRRRKPGVDVVCPEPGHASSTVVRNGTRKVGGFAYQRYLCRPTNGDAPHTLRSEIPGSTTPAPPPPLLPERCPKHPSARTVRDGRARTSHGVERQMYRCYPDNGEEPHRFRPVLSRLVVEHGETCPECAALRGVNQGDTTAARGHKFTTRIVAASLERLAADDPDRQAAHRPSW